MSEKNSTPHGNRKSLIASDKTVPFLNPLPGSWESPRKPSPAPRRASLETIGISKRDFHNNEIRNFAARGGLQT